ncbi:Glycosyltransferase involved in cell wall biosynthesis [Candidatus Fervidibacteria bacterium JGI MDM2 JNZ-1-D12]
MPYIFALFQSTMKVLVLAPSLDGCGGVQRYTTILLRALGELLGAEKVRVLALPTKHQKSRRLSLKSKWQFTLQALKAAWQWRPDLVICTHVGLAPVGWLLRMLRQRPYWVVAHGIEVWGALPFWKRNALRKAERVLAVSAFTRNRLIERHQVSPERIAVLPNTLDGSLLTIPPDGERLTRLGVNGRRVILTVGRLVASERYKGHDVVLQALPAVLTKVPNAVYLVVGDGDDRARLERLAQQLGVQNHVVFTGQVTDAELAACYRACDVFALPAQTVLDDHAPKGEGFGIVFLEAMAFGKPVVGPNYGAPAEFIRHGEHGLLVDPKSPDEVAEAIITLLTQPERARRMGEAGRAWVMQEFSYERFKERLVEVLGLRMADSQ